MIVDGYVRVSQVAGRHGERFISTDVQRERIERWADSKGALIAHVFEELDQSGARADRPLLMRAIERVERGESNGVVVAYLSRFGRSLMDGLAAIDRITRAGGSFVSVEEGLDFSTDTGRLVLRFMFSVAEWELDRMRSAWATANERAIARGVGCGQRPFGYVRPRGRPLVVHPMEGPVVRELFERRAAGERLAQLRDSLFERGVETAKGHARWTSTGMRDMFRNRVYRGELRWGPYVNRTAHPPIVDEKLWQAAQSDPRTELPTLGLLEPALLRGIIRCAGCQRPLSSTSHDRDTSRWHRLYICGGMGGRGRVDPCPNPSQVSDQVVEPYLEELFWQELVRARRRPAHRRIARLKTQLERRERELVTYRDNERVQDTLGPERFANGVAARLSRIEHTQVELSRARMTIGTASLPDVAELRREWPSMGLAARRSAIAQVIESAFLAAGQRPLPQRLSVYATGSGPRGLPRVFERGIRVSKPFEASHHQPSVVLERPPSTWDEDELRRALLSFTAGRDHWPSFIEFQAAGLAMLHAQMKRHGGPRRWAMLLGVPFRAPGGPTGAWSDERIERELRAFFRGHSAWMPWSEFRAAGKGQLRLAVGHRGGPERWAETLGLALPVRFRSREPWTYARIRADLAGFTAGRRDWPPMSEFDAAGLSRLYMAINRRGIRHQLAAELRLRLPPDGQRLEPPRRPWRWTDERVAEMLDTILVGRSRFPTGAEMRGLGLSGLHKRLVSSGTRKVWADRYGVRLPSRGKGEGGWEPAVFPPAGASPPARGAL